MYAGSFSYKSRTGFIFMWGVSLTHPMLAFYFCGEFVLHILSWAFSQSLSLMWWFSFLFLSGEFLLHIPRWLYFSMGSFSYTSQACLIFLWGVSLTRPIFFLFFFPFFCFNLGSFSYTSRAGFIFMRGVSLKHPVLALFFYGEFLLHIPCLFDFSVGSFSYTSHAGLCVCVGVGVCVWVWKREIKMKNKSNNNITGWLCCPKQRPRSHHRLQKVTAGPPAIGSEISTNMEWLPVKPSLQ